MLQKPNFGISNKTLISILVLSLTLLISPGYIATGSPEGEGITEVTKLASASPERILIGVIPWMGHAPWVVAEENGFFLNEGLNMKVVVFPDQVSLYNAFGAGNIHFPTGMVGDYVLMAAKGHPISIVMEVNLGIGHMVIIKSNFNDLAELRGKAIACEIGTMDYLLLLKTLERYGLTANDVGIINMTAQEGTVAFIKGTVDGVVLWEPLASHALKRGEGKVVMTSKDIPVIPNGIYVQSEILENSPDMVVRALRSYFKGLRWGEGHSDEYYEVANKKLFYRDLQTRRDLVCSQSSVKMFKPKEIKERMKDNGQLYQYCQEVLNFYNDLGVVKSKPNLEDFIDNELYLGALGAYYE